MHQLRYLQINHLYYKCCNFATKTFLVFLAVLFCLCSSLVPTRPKREPFQLSTLYDYYYYQTAEVVGCSCCCCRCHRRCALSLDREWRLRCLRSDFNHSPSDPLTRTAASEAGSQAASQPKLGTTTKATNEIAELPAGRPSVQRTRAEQTNQPTLSFRNNTVAVVRENPKKRTSSFGPPPPPPPPSSSERQTERER